MKTNSVQRVSEPDSVEVSRLRQLKDESLAGRSRPASVRTIAMGVDGSIVITELDPEDFRKDRARAFESGE